MVHLLSFFLDRSIVLSIDPTPDPDEKQIVRASDGLLGDKYEPRVT